MVKLRLYICVMLGVLLSGCATRSSVDPLEPFNRAMFKFNEKLDEHVAKPVARGYVAVIPTPVRSCVSNFFGNLGDVWTGVNNFLQNKGHDAINDWGRFMVNTTMGFLGCRDVATELGVPKHREDFGQTLGKWGVSPGFYIVMPIMGPTTARDAVASGLADQHFDPILYIDSVRTRNGAIMLRAIDLRARFLDAGNLLNDVVLDKYTFARDAYLQRRKNMVYDGDVPEEEEATPVAKDETVQPLQEEPASAAPSQSGASTEPSPAPPSGNAP